MSNIDLPGKVLAFPLDIVVRAYEKEADDDLIETVRTFSKNPLYNLPADAQKNLDRAVAQFDKVFKSYESAEDKTEWRDYLDASYADLYLGVSQSVPIPIQSAYLGTDNLINNKSYFEVKQAMDEEGWKKPQDFHDPEDHIAMEWKFFAYLLEKDPSGLKATAFKEAQMDRWMDDVLANTIKGDDVGFYAGITYLCKAILACMAK